MNADNISRHSIISLSQEVKSSPILRVRLEIAHPLM